MHRSHREQAARLLDSLALDGALFALPASVTWLTGYAAPVQVGPSVFAGGPPLLWFARGRWTLIVFAWQAPAAADYAADDDITVLPYPGYRTDGPLAGGAAYLEALEGALAQTPSAARVGIERAVVPEGVADRLRSRFGHAPAPLDDLLRPLRLIKSAEELARMRANFALGEHGFAAARRAVVAGATEIDVWTAAKSAVEIAAGGRVAMGNDCIVGTRQANDGGWPGALPIRHQDSVIVDLSVIVNGYWSDGCITCVAGEPTAMQRTLHKIVSEALEIGRKHAPARRCGRGYRPGHAPSYRAGGLHALLAPRRPRHRCGRA
jgi:Xaa-Pro dipeptidase